MRLSVLQADAPAFKQGRFLTCEAHVMAALRCKVHFKAKLRSKVYFKATLRSEVNGKSTQHAKYCTLPHSNFLAGAESGFVEYDVPLAKTDRSVEHYVCYATAQTAEHTAGMKLLQ